MDRDQGNLTIPQPALNILPTKDQVANWVEVAKIMKSADFVPHLEVAVSNIPYGTWYAN